MNSINREIFEKHQVRKTKKQKTLFRKYLTESLTSLGYKTKVEKGSLGSKNLIVGDPETAKVVFTAHYDTCPVLPFPNFNTPTSIPIYILYQIILTALLLIPSVLLCIFAELALYALSTPDAELHLSSDIVFIILYLGLIGTLYLMLFGPANKHTANDNTSGVTTLIDIMVNMDPAVRDNAAFIFFDNEEIGLIGSSSYAKAHPAVRNEKLVINFDCVSDGNYMLFALRRGAVKHEKLIKEAFSSGDGIVSKVCDRGVFYPSDQHNFSCGVGVAALRRSRICGVLYLSRIHTRRDTVYKEENISYITNRSIALINILAASDNDL